MVLRFSLLTFVCLISMVSCKESKKGTNDQTQMKNVMAVHDKVMPKMSTLAKYTAELKAKVDTTEMGMRYKTAMTDLQDANKAMMDWMMGFGERFDHEEIMKGKPLTAQKQKWLNEEEKKVKALENQINSSIERAEALLNAAD